MSVTSPGTCRERRERRADVLVEGTVRQHDRDDGFVADMVEFGLTYSAVVREDHRHFVEAFREGRIPGVSAT